MAYTSVIPVRRLDRTVDYVQNKEKTTPKSLEEAVDYAANRDKTESACFETGLGCTTTSAFEDMRLNTLRWHKETGVQGYHLVQSFAEGEVTPELAHQIGVEFAEQLLLGKYQAIVTTHLNTKHYHNHIVWSAVSLEDGKKYHSNSKSYYTEVRALSDALCQKYGLSIIETPEALRGKRQYEKWRAEENNQPTWRTAIRQDVDEAIQQSLTSSPSRCSVRCRLKSPAAIVSRQLTNANDTKAAITANMPYPNDWSAETAAALISGLLGTSTAENKSFGDASIDSNTEQNFAVIHRQSRKKNCIRLF